MENETLLQLIQVIMTCLLAVASIIAAIIAYFTYQNSKKQKIRDTTVSIITKMTSDAHLAHMLERFRQLRYFMEGPGKEIKNWEEFNKTTFVIGERAHSASQTLKDMFNFYEAISLGVVEGWLDKEIIKDFWRSSLVLDWLDFQIIVQDFRDNGGAGSELFSKYEALARDWAIGDEPKKFLKSHPDGKA